MKKKIYEKFYFWIIILPIIATLLISSILFFTRGTAITETLYTEEYLMSIKHLSHEISPQINQNILDINRIYAGEVHIIGCIDEDCVSNIQSGSNAIPNPILHVGRYTPPVSISLPSCQQVAFSKNIDLGKPEKIYEKNYQTDRNDYKTQQEYEIALKENENKYLEAQNQYNKDFNGYNNSINNMVGQSPGKTIIFLLDPSFLIWNPHIHETIKHQLDDSTFQIDGNCARISEQKLILYERVDCLKDNDCIDPKYSPYAGGGICSSDYKCLFGGKVVEQEQPQIEKPTNGIEVTSIQEDKSEINIFYFVVILLGLSLIGAIIYIISFRKKKKR